MYKQTFPDEAALEKVVAEQLSDITHSVKNEIGHLEADYKRIKRNQKIAGILGVIFVLAMSASEVIVEFFIPSISTPVLIGGGIMVVGGFVLAGRKIYQLYRGGSQLVREFEQKLNHVLFNRILELFSLKGSYLEHTYSLPVEGVKNLTEARSFISNIHKKHGVFALTAESQQVIALLDHSELVTESRNRVHVDDMLSIDVGGRSLFVSELDIKHETGSGKNRKVKKIFKGYFVSFDLPRPLTGKTFVSTEGDKKGFGHMSFWKSKTGDNIRETILEWNEFEKLLHVATNNESEARYVLPPDFMHDLYEWWQHKKQNIRLSFIAHRMYILYPDNNIRIKNTVPDLSEKHIQSYILTIAKPLLHVLHLVEDVARVHR